jgi:hypothetical protein
MLLDRRDRTRFEKLGSGKGNFTGLLVKFGLCLAWLVAGRRGESFTKAVLRLSRFCSSWKGGTASLVKYLKACQVTLMQAVSKGPVSEPRELGCVMSRGLGKLPRIIPHSHRVSIMRGVSGLPARLLLKGSSLTPLGSMRPAFPWHTC